MREKKFSSLQQEVISIKDGLSNLEKRANRIFKTKTKNVGAFFYNLEDIKKRVAKIEQRIQAQTA